MADIIKLNVAGVKAAVELVRSLVGKNRTNESRKAIRAALKSAGFANDEADRFKGYKPEKLLDVLRDDISQYAPQENLPKEEVKILLPTVNKKKATSIKYVKSPYNYGKQFAYLVTYSVDYPMETETKQFVLTYSTRKTKKKIREYVIEEIFPDNYEIYNAMPDPDSIEIVKCFVNDAANRAKLKKQAADRAAGKKEPSKRKSK